MAFSFPSLFSKQAQSAIGVDIGTSAIKVVQLRREKGRVLLETYGALSLGPYAGLEIGRATALSADKLGDALKDVLREANVTVTDAAVSIPYASSLISVIRLPAAVERQLAQVVPIEARKFIPVAMTEVQLDWFVVGGPVNKSDPAAKIEVLLVAIHNDTIAKFRAIAAAAALQVAFFEIEVFSATRAVLEHGIAPVAVVDIGAATTKFYVVQRGLIHESHIINHGAQDLTLAASRALNLGIAQAEEYKRRFGLIEGSASGTTIMGHPQLKQSLELSLSPLFSELSRTIAGWESRTNEALSSLVLTGGGATLKGLLPFAQKVIQTEIRVSQPFDKVQAPAFLESILKEAGPEFSVAVGLALRRLQEMG
jgi:type IV pilus assembly protein PilM